MEEYLNTLIDWVSSHTLWAGTIVFFVAFAESVAILGLLVPGVVMMFTFGALIATGALDFWLVFWCAVAGAVAGDGLSFWLGRHFQDQLTDIWPFNRHPSTLQQGIEFFEKYGGKSVAIGRFFGPVRAIIPLVAGMLDMRPWLFVAANLLSALVWAPAYLLPGVVFGASLELASEVAFRLVVVLLLAVGLIWFSFALVKRLFRLIQPQATRVVIAIMRWGSQHPRYSEVIHAMGDPNHPEARGLGMLATGLLLGTILFGLIAAAVLQGTVFSQPDHLLFNALQSMRTPWSDRLLIQVSALADVTTILVIGLVIGLHLIYHRHYRALNHWLAALAFGLVSPLLLKYGLQIPRPFEVEGLGPWSFPSAHVLRATVTYGFLAILIARVLSIQLRWLPYSLTGVIVVSVAFSRLYLGVHWLSDVLGSLLLGLAWISALGLAYYRHTKKEHHWLGLSIGMLVALFISQGALNQMTDEELVRYQPSRPAQFISREVWQAGDTPHLPTTRQDAMEKNTHPLNIQLAGQLDSVANFLANDGWQPAEMLDWHNLLHLLSPSSPLQVLPVLPQVHDGQHESLTLVKSLAADNRLVFRLWSSPLRLSPNGTPIWLGNVTQQRKTTLMDLLVFAETQPDFATPFQLLQDSLAPLQPIVREDPKVLLLIYPQIE